MLRNRSKRGASTSSADLQRDAKRQCLASDLWSIADHQLQDEQVRQRLHGRDSKPRKYDVDDETLMAIVLTHVGTVALNGKDSHLFHVPELEPCIIALEDDPELLRVVGEAYTSGSYKDVRCLKLFRKSSVSTVPNHTDATSGQKKAVEKSWEREFSGGGAQALWNHIARYYNYQHSGAYAQYTAIVQSSGMGKSRTVDELGKTHFVIPINLRASDSTGFPPADDEVRNFLTAEGSQVDTYGRVCAFLEALFEHAAATICKELEDIDDVELPSRFRTRMTKGQTFQNPNPFRKAFYRGVIQKATQKFVAALSKRDAKQSTPGYTSPNAKGDVYEFSPAQACEDLVTLLSGEPRGSPKPSLSKSQQKKTAKGDGPLIILAFDEAHTLTEQKNTVSTQWSSFSELQHALRSLGRFPCFSLFMSTTGKISQFTSPPNEDISRRILSGELVLIPPFTDVGFDTLAHKISLNQGWNLDELASISHMVYLGRPLFGSLYDAGDRAVREDIIKFAAAKLLNAEPDMVEELTDNQKLACLSHRIPLEFNSTTYISQTDERKQVEGHMRVCLELDTAFESMVTVSASEPLLSEAAYSIMARMSFNVPEAMESVLERFSIHKGDRGEFLIMLLLIVARDKVVGPPVGHGCIPAGSRIMDVASFLSGGLFKSLPSLQALQNDFPDSKMHLNHYVKVHESIDAKSLLLLSSRGAGILYANGQYGTDGINPFFFHGTSLNFGNLGMMLWRVMNDASFPTIHQSSVFEAMDVYKLNILKEGDAAVPLIKIVFALAARTPSLTVVRHPPSFDYNAVVYEILCAGISPDIFNAVEPSQAKTWFVLLQASYGWKSVYEGGGVDKELRRSMNPGAATDVGHWSSWAERSDERVD